MQRRQESTTRGGKHTTASVRATAIAVPDEEESPSELNRKLINIEVLPSPLDLRVESMQAVSWVPKLLWYNTKTKPHRMKITNTGHTVMVTGKWGHRKPYIHGGAFTEDYVFDNLHFHWGLDDSEGSEHRVDGLMLPLEMHALWRKDSYLTHKEAIKKKDGVVMICYLFKVSQEDNLRLKPIIGLVEHVRSPNDVHRLDVPLSLDDILEPVSEDYLLYFGRVSQEYNEHHTFFIISRTVNTISRAQLSEFRKVCGLSGECIRNFRSPPDESPTKGVYYVRPTSLPPTSVLISLKTGPTKPSKSAASKVYTTNCLIHVDYGEDGDEEFLEPGTAKDAEQEGSGQKKGGIQKKTEWYGDKPEISHWAQVQARARKRITTNKSTTVPWQY